MKNYTRLLFGTLLAATLVSCGDKDKGDQEPIKQPVEQPVSAPVTEPTPPADPTAMFRTPKDDTLPTQAQLDQGKHSSIGTGADTVNHTEKQPNVAAKPPKPANNTDDQLAPEE